MTILWTIIILLITLVIIVAIWFFIYATRWTKIEKQVRNSLQAEFENKKEQAFKKIDEQTAINENKWKEMIASLQLKINEAEAMQEKNIHAWKIQAKKEILQTMAFVINSLYNSNQTKTKLQAFVNKVQEQIKF